MKKIILFLSLVTLFVSCEDVIEVDLDNIEPKIVIEAVINDLGEGCSVKISKTADYFEPGDYSNVSDAIVTVTANNNQTFDFIETDPGVYFSDELQGLSNTTYSLNVLVNNESYDAEVHFPEKVDIEKLTFEETPLYMDFEGGYVVNCHLRDPFEAENFYRLKAYKINSPETANKSKVLYNDDFVEGNSIELQYFDEQYFENDTVVVELHTLDKSTYQYYNTLFLLEDNIFGSANPSNPKTNLNNDALGFFAAYSVSRDTIVIK